MTKLELINELAKELEMPKIQVEKVLNALPEKFKKGIEWKGFLTTSVKTVAAATKRNPITGEPVQTVAHNVLTIKLSSAYKKSV